MWLCREAHKLLGISRAALCCDCCHMCWLTLSPCLPFLPWSLFPPLPSSWSFEGKVIGAQALFWLCRGLWQFHKHWMAKPEFMGFHYSFLRPAVWNDDFSVNLSFCKLSSVAFLQAWVRVCKWDQMAAQELGVEKVRSHKCDTKKEKLLKTTQFEFALTWSLNPWLWKSFSVDRNCSIPYAHMVCQVSLLSSQASFEFSHVQSGSLRKTKKMGTSLCCFWSILTFLDWALQRGVVSLPWSVASLRSDVILAVIGVSQG